MIDPHIFRAYDIRGKADTELTDDACFLIGHAFGGVLIEKYGHEHSSPTVVVGRDARTHSPKFEARLIAGLLKAGCTVNKIGQTPSPINYFTICHGSFDAGVQITASHNPKEDNGVKLQLRNAEAFSGEDLQELRKRIEKTDYSVLLPVRQAGTTNYSLAKDYDAIAPYIETLTKTFAGVGKGRHIVVDGGNGVAGPVYCEVLRKIGAKVTEIYTEPDGNFPNHAADPSKHETLAELQEKVVAEKVDGGFAYDGDGDRMGLVDEKGAIVTADQTLLLLAKDHLSRHAGAPVIFTVSNSGLLETEVKKWGGIPVMCKVGHSFVEHAMRDHHALLGGEQSGHFFCGEDYYGFDDALVASLRILKILQKKVLPSPLRWRGARGEGIAQEKGSGDEDLASRAAVPSRGRRSISTLIADFPIVFQSPERRPYCPDHRKADVVARVTEHFLKTHPVVTLDGARIDFGDGAWAGIRYSNTSPVLSICIEARSKEKLKAVEATVLQHLEVYSEISLYS